MPTDPKAAATAAARAALAAAPGGPLAVRVEETRADGLVCLVQLWNGGAGVPTARAAAAEKRARNGRADCRADILAAVAAAGGPLTRKALIRALKDAGARHGPGTVAKALAELTAGGELVNPRDWKGYRLAGWPAPAETPSLFN